MPVWVTTVNIFRSARLIYPNSVPGRKTNRLKMEAGMKDPILSIFVEIENI